MAAGTCCAKYCIVVVLPDNPTGPATGCSMCTRCRRLFCWPGPHRNYAYFVSRPFRRRCSPAKPTPNPSAISPCGNGLLPVGVFAEFGQEVDDIRLREPKTVPLPGGYLGANRRDEIQGPQRAQDPRRSITDRKSTRLNSSHRCISYAVFCL